MSRLVRVVVIEGQAVFDSGAGESILATLRDGGLVVYPTDTLYGLGADPFRAEAVARVFAAKRRPPGEPVSVVVPDLEAAQRLAVISPRQQELCRPWLPGPVTLLFAPAAGAPATIISSRNTIAIRVPKHPVALFLAKQFGPITATSANVHGKAPPIECADAREQLGDSVDLYVDAGPSPLGRESTIIDFSGGEPRVIREGAVSARHLGLERRDR